MVCGISNSSVGGLPTFMHVWMEMEMEECDFFY